MENIIKARDDELIEAYTNLHNRLSLIEDEAIREIVQGKIILIAQELKFRRYRLDDFSGWQTDQSLPE